MDFSNEIPDAITPEILAELKGESTEETQEVPGFVMNNADNIVVPRKVLLDLIEVERRYLLSAAEGIKSLKDDPTYPYVYAMSQLLNWAMSNRTLRMYIENLPPA